MSCVARESRFTCVSLHTGGGDDNVDCAPLPRDDCVHDLRQRSGASSSHPLLSCIKLSNHSTHLSQLDQIVQFALERAGSAPSCSPLVNCAVLITMAFLPIFPVTLLRNLTPLQFTSTAR